MLKFLEIFFQDYSDEPELKIPSHWCVKYLPENSGFVDYTYHSTEDEAIEWAKKNTDYENEFDLMLIPSSGEDTDKILDEVFSKGYGHAEVITPEEWFDVKKFNFIKESRTNNLYDYFPIWFEELCNIEGVYLAGGSLRNLLGGKDIIADIDLFFNGETALKKAENVMQMYEGSEDGCWYEAFRCPAGELITYKTAIDKPDEDKTPEDYKNQRKVQFITKSFYDSPEQLINSFDFIPTCACMYQDVLYTHPDWVSHVKKRTLGLHFVSYPVATLSRLLKYSHKGYHVMPETLLGLVQQINEQDFDGDRLALYVD